MSDGGDDGRRFYGIFNLLGRVISINRARFSHRCE